MASGRGGRAPSPWIGGLTCSRYHSQRRSDRHPARCSAPRGPAVGQALYHAGFRVIEVPLNSPDPYQHPRAARRLPADRLMGAGTVLLPEPVEMAAAGGHLVVMPHSDARCCAPPKPPAWSFRPAWPRPPKPSLRWPRRRRGADVSRRAPGPGRVKAWLAVLPPTLFAAGGWHRAGQPRCLSARAPPASGWVRGCTDPADLIRSPAASRLCRRLETPGLINSAPTVAASINITMKITRLTTYIVPPRWCFLKSRPTRYHRLG